METRVKGINEKTVIHCPTKELSYQVVEGILHKAGVYTNHNTDEYWDNYKENMCYFVDDCTHCYLDYFKGDKYEIISAEEFIKLNSPLAERTNLNTKQEMKKEDVAVRIDTVEQAKRAYQILTDAKEKMSSPEDLELGDMGGVEYRWIYLHLNTWCRTNTNSGRTVITLDELEELLGVKRAFKVGDRVRCVSAISGCQGAVGQTGLVVEKMLSQYQSAGLCAGDDYDLLLLTDAYFNNNTNPRCWRVKGTFELIKKAEETTADKPVTHLSISRANLKTIFEFSCESWKEVIRDVVLKHDQFDDIISFDIETVKKGYHAASCEQVEKLKKLLPLPSTTKTVEISRWVSRNVNGDEFIYTTKEEAEQKRDTVTNYKWEYTAVEVKGSYTMTVEYDYDEFENLPF